MIMVVSKARSSFHVSSPSVCALHIQCDIRNTVAVSPSQSRVTQQFVSDGIMVHLGCTCYRTIFSLSVALSLSSVLVSSFVRIYM